MNFQPGIRTGTTSQGGTKVTFYDSVGSDVTRPPIVLLHGTAGSAINNFWALFPMLAMRHRVIALDFVDPEDSEPTLEHYVGQAVSVIDELSPGRRATVVGYSLGAVIAASLAAHHPGLVDNLVLVAGWMKTDIQQRLRNDLWHSLNDLDRDALAAFMVLTAYSPRFLRSKTENELRDLVSKAGAGPDRGAKMALNRTIDLSAELGRITASTLVIGCTEDQMAPIWHSELLFGGIADARFASIPSGHGVVHERPSELFTLIDIFVSEPHRFDSGAVLTSDHA
ncbi:alpha/beta fold hydrolase [Rhodococcus wratislaviensis]|uniref:Putative hydrolase n=1 Tax=Rhodococcus wratislaviensis NBRC 100605 TaxID=1219028 RepID=X0PMA7_RHOWR|nr:alpha/beta hydrolase [Rhodococcus wratislaviensis]GAF43684.1 putative hydrolase [Rhodococcus wratislaviensis NBRC 100605]